MNRFDRRLKGVNNKTSSNSSSGSGAACVPQPIPTRAPLLSGMMFGGGGGIRRTRITNNVNQNSSNVNTKSLEGLVNEVSKNTTSVEKISNNNIEMLSRRISRLETSNNVHIKANRAYEKLEKRLANLEEMYGKNMESMEKYVNNQQDRIISLSGEYKATLEKLNIIIAGMNKKIIELSDVLYNKDLSNNSIVSKEVKIKEEITNEESVKIEEVTQDIVKNIEEKVENINVPVKKIQVSDKIENENIINEIMEEVKSKVEEKTNNRNITLEIVEN